MVNVLQYKRIATNTPYEFDLLVAVCRSLDYKIKTESLEKRVLISLLPVLAEMYNMSILDLLEKDTPFYKDFSKISNCFERFHDLVWDSLSESDRLFVQFRRKEVDFCNIAQHNLTKEICSLAVQRLALNIIWTPDNCKTPEMCKEALKRDQIY